MPNLKIRKKQKGDGLDKRTIEHFSRAEEYKHAKGILNIDDPITLEFVSQHSTTESKVLEVGGGSGYMLDLISNLGIKNLYNCELVAEHYKKQSNPNISLIGANVFCLPFKSKTFDLVIIRNLLHHLVSHTKAASRTNAEKAAKELMRVTTRGGYIIVFEQYHQDKLFSTIIFYVTKLLSRFEFELKPFYRKKAIISFLTPQEINSLFTQSNSVEVIYAKDNRFNVEAYNVLKYSVIMKNVGTLLTIFRLKNNP